MSKQQERHNIFQQLLNVGYDGGTAGAIANDPNIHNAHKRFRNALRNAPGKPAPQRQPQQAQAPKEVKPVTPPVRISQAGNVGVRQNKKTKKKAGQMSIARSANVQPLQAGAVGYQGLRIS